MVSYLDLTNAMVDALRRIPELVADLDPPDPASIIGYIDSNPPNSLALARYQQKGGTVLVAVTETILAEGEMAWWVHRVEFTVRPQRLQSTYKIVDDIMRGVPNPGDGERWYRCPVMAGLDPTQIMRLARDSDTEQIDFWTIETETKETGDL